MTRAGKPGGPARSGGGRGQGAGPGKGTAGRPAGGSRPGAPAGGPDAAPGRKPARAAGSGKPEAHGASGWTARASDATTPAGVGPAQAGIARAVPALGDSVWARAQGGDPAEHRAALEAAAQSLGLNLDSQVFDRLQAYQALLLRWNKVYNLSAIRDADRMRVQHLVDCLAVLPALQRRLGEAPAASAAAVAAEAPGTAARVASPVSPASDAAAPQLSSVSAGAAGQGHAAPGPSSETGPDNAQAMALQQPAAAVAAGAGAGPEAAATRQAAAEPPLRPAHTSPQRRILDVGSGGGLPGVVLAIARPDWAVDCVDTVAKKSSFIRQVAAELGLRNLRGLHSRVETLASAVAMPVGSGVRSAPSGAADKEGYDLVTSRAFASLADFTRLTAHLLGPSGEWAAMKGRMPDDEMAQLGDAAAVFHVEQLIVPGLDAERCLVWMRPAKPS